jgi:hypothetical protein
MAGGRDENQRRLVGNIEAREGAAAIEEIYAR